MSGLVAYGSSSEEADDEGPKAPKHKEASSSPTAIAATHGARQQIENVKEVGDVSEKPMVGPALPPSESEQQLAADGKDVLVDGMSEEDIIRRLTSASHPMTSIPPSPPGSPDPVAEAKLKRFLQLKQQGLHFNEDLAKKATFRNPRLLAYLMARAGLADDDQYATSLPPSVWDPASLPQYSYKEELARSQASIRDQQATRKKKEAAAGGRSIGFVPGRESRRGG